MGSPASDRNDANAAHTPSRDVIDKFDPDATVTPVSRPCAETALGEIGARGTTSNVPNRMRYLIVAVVSSCCGMLGLSGTAASAASTVAPNVRTNPLRLPDTNYAIPTSNAVFVSPTGDDANPGTAAKPLQTITAGIQRVPVGGTVVLRGGVYREKVMGGGFTKAVTLQAYPHERPWVDGSEVVSGWNRIPRGSASPVYRHDGWSTPELCRGRSLTYHSCVSFSKSGTGAVYVDGQVVDAAGNVLQAGNATAALLDQVFLNGQPLTQVATATAVGPGKFFVDVTAKQLLIGDDPTGDVVEATVHDVAYVNHAPSRVLGIGFRRFGSAPSNSIAPAAVALLGDGSVIRDASILHSSATGLIVGGVGSSIDDTAVAFSGLMGARSDSAVGLTVTNSLFAYNNREGFPSNTAAAVSAGFKITNSRRIAGNAPVIRDNDFIGNAGVGLWFDVGVDGGVAAGNLAMNNTESGIFYEISKNGMIVDNHAVNNGTAGNAFAANIRTTGSFNVTIANNTVVGAQVGIGVYSDGRGSMRGIAVTNNVLANVTGTKAAFNVQAASPVTNAGLSANPTQWFSVVDGNAYLDNRGATSDIAVKPWGAKVVTYATVLDARTIGFERRGSDAPATPFVNPSTLDYHLKTPASGAVLTAAVRNLLSAAAPSTTLVGIA